MTRENDASVERRASLRVPVDMWVEDLTGGNQIFRRAGNLSRGGLHIDHSIPIPVGSAVNLRITLADGDPPLLLAGRVVSIDTSEELGMGIAFDAVPPEARARLDAFVAAHRPGGH